jgi:hypothetical protein
MNGGNVALLRWDACWCAMGPRQGKRYAPAADDAEEADERMAEPAAPAAPGRRWP